MATTTNYAWETPDDTDLVKDGALAIRTLGSNIDTSMADLLGGTTGQILTKASGTNMDFTWATPAGGGGKVLQVIQATTSTAASTNSATYQNSNLTATITPSFSTSKVLIMTYQSIALSRGTVSDAGAYINLVRDSTDILSQTNTTIYFENDTGHKWPISCIYLDSPATTSATVYKTQIKTGSTSHTVTAQPGSTPSVMILMEIGA